MKLEDLDHQAQSNLIKEQYKYSSAGGHGGQALFLAVQRVTEEILIVLINASVQLRQKGRFQNLYLTKNQTEH